MSRPQKSLTARAVDLLSRREHSRSELERKLAQHAESPEQLAEVLDALAKRGWQSDARYAEQLAYHKGSKYGSRRLRDELRHKGVDSELINSALEQQNDDALARQLWQRKFGSLPTTPQERAKQMRFLAARGIPMDSIRKVLSGSDDDYDYPED